MAQSQDFTGVTNMHAANPGEHLTSIHGQPQYLPEYLLGDPTSVATSPVHSHRLWSANLNESYHSPGGKKRSSTASMQLLGTPLSVNPQRYGRSSLTDKHGSGPPTQGLFDQSQATTSPLGGMTPRTLSFANQNVSGMTTPVSHIDFGSSTNKALNQTGTMIGSPSPAQLDPFYTQREALKVDEELDGTWVTVFGFPPSAVSLMLQQFSQYGNILEHKMSGGNNWIHLHYQSKIQAKKALAKNGKIFGGNMMIGVTPCIDKHVMMDSGKENLSITSPLSFNVGYESGIVGRSTKPLGMRSLSQAYKAAGSEHEVLSCGSTPQKQGGSVVSKAMEYVFGW